MFNTILFCMLIIGAFWAIFGEDLYETIQRRKTVKMLQGQGHDSMTRVLSFIMKKSEEEWNYNGYKLSIDLNKEFIVEYIAINGELVIKNKKTDESIFEIWHGSSIKEISNAYDIIRKRLVMKNEKLELKQYLRTINELSEKCKRGGMKKEECGTKKENSLLMQEGIQGKMKEIIKNKKWLSYESLHKIEVTIPHDVNILFETYNTLKDKEKGKKEVEKSLKAIDAKITSMMDEIENNKLRELSIRRKIIEKR